MGYWKQLSNLSYYFSNKLVFQDNSWNYLHGGHVGGIKTKAIAYDREVKDLVFFYKAVNGYIDIDVSNFVNFVNHGRTRRALRSKYLETPLCKTCTYSSSYFNRVIKLWNSVCVSIDPSSFTSSSSFKLYLKMRYKNILETVSDPDMTCT